MHPDDWCKTHDSLWIDCIQAGKHPEQSSDKSLPEDAAIKAAHPCRTERHDLYAEAMRLVGAKHSKAALVELVNWLLWRLEESEKKKVRRGK